MEVHPIYVLKARRRTQSSVRNPLSLFDPESLDPMIEDK
jgi:serine protein kinase